MDSCSMVDSNVMMRSPGKIKPCMSASQREVKAGRSPCCEKWRYPMRSPNIPPMTALTSILNKRSRMPRVFSSVVFVFFIRIIRFHPPYIQTNLQPLHCIFLLVLVQVLQMGSNHLARSSWWFVWIHLHVYQVRFDWSLTWSDSLLVDLITAIPTPPFCAYPEKMTTFLVKYIIALTTIFVNTFWLLYETFFARGRGPRYTKTWSHLIHSA